MFFLFLGIICAYSYYYHVNYLTQQQQQHRQQLSSLSAYQAIFHNHNINHINQPAISTIFNNNFHHINNNDNDHFVYEIDDDHPPRYEPPPKYEELDVAHLKIFHTA